MPTETQRVETDRGWRGVFDIAYECRNHCDRDGYWGDIFDGFNRLREVWNYSNDYPTESKLKLVKAQRWPRYLDAPWIADPRYASVEA